MNPTTIRTEKKVEMRFVLRVPVGIMIEPVPGFPTEEGRAKFRVTVEGHDDGKVIERLYALRHALDELIAAGVGVEVEE